MVLPDADLEFAADALIGAAYGSAGERCMAISAVVAVGSAGDKLVALLKGKAEKIKVGPGDTKARFRVDGVAAVRQLLQSLVNVEARVGAALSRDHG